MVFALSTFWQVFVHRGMHSETMQDKVDSRADLADDRESNPNAGR